jgi:hypothetical protein
MGPAKAALEATSRQLAYELGEQNIRVNCVSPGPMNTVSARGIPGISVSITIVILFHIHLLRFSYIIVENENLCRGTFAFKKKNQWKRSR